jgi:hypothetical protein
VVEYELEETSDPSSITEEALTGRTVLVEEPVLGAGYVLIPMIS